MLSQERTARGDSLQGGEDFWVCVTVTTGCSGAVACMQLTKSLTQGKGAGSGIDSSSTPG